MSMNDKSISCIKPVLESLGKQELSYLYYLSIEGKNIFDKFEDFSSEKDIIEEIVSYYDYIYENRLNIPIIGNQPSSKLGKNELVDIIINKLYINIKEGLGVIDKILKGLDDYNNQLKLVIETFVDFYLEDIKKNPTKYRNIKLHDYVNQLREIKDNINFLKGSHCEKAIQLEETLMILLLQNYIVTLSDEDLKKFQDAIKKELDKVDLSSLGIENISEVLSSVLIGNLILLRQILGFTFHKILAIVVNTLAKSLFGINLSFAANAAIQRITAVFLGGLFAWILMVLLSIPTIADLINPRRYDRYIPVVLYIHMKRKNLEDFWKEIEEINTI